MITTMVQSMSMTFRLRHGLLTDSLRSVGGRANLDLLVDALESIAFKNTAQVSGSGSNQNNCNIPERRHGGSGGGSTWLAADVEYVSARTTTASSG